MCMISGRHILSSFLYSKYAKLSENVWKEAEKMLEQIQKYPQKEEYQKLVEADRINLYEREAEKGDDRKFLEETDPGFSKKILKEILHGNYMKESLFIWNQNSQISAGSLNDF